MQSESFATRTFTVDDPDARLRVPGSLLEFVREGPDFRRIPRGTRVHIAEIAIVPVSTRDRIVFGHAVGTNRAALGWTSTRNLAGRFVNETLGEVPPPAGTGRYGPNAAWQGGTFIGQRTLVRIVDARLEIEHVALDTLGAYQALCAAAAADGVAITLNSGFRSYAEQKRLHEDYTRDPSRFPRAAEPGSSNHQNGIAFDIAVAGGAGNPTYDWLARHATAHGFVRTVSKEPWHWEHDPAKAAKAAQRGTFTTPNVRI
ncbi:MAG: M15 family metallopeptidase [bacterium]|nr:M15 family metallopeptidase [bacterium]